MGVLLVLFGVFATCAFADPTSETHKLLPSDGYEFGLFGISAALTEDRIFVGAPYDNELVPNAGAVYVYDIETGAQLQKLMPPSGATPSFFGWNVIVEGGTLIVSAMIDSTFGASHGAIYVFDLHTYAVLQTFGDTSLSEGGRLGRSLDSDGRYLVAGAPDEGGFVGEARVFDMLEEELLHTILPPSVPGSQRFGADVAVGEGVFVVTRRLERVDGLSNAGAAYVYDLQSGELLTRLTQPNPSLNNYFGVQVAIGCGKIFVSSRYSGVSNGAVFVYDAETLGYLTALPGVVYGSEGPHKFGTRLDYADGMLMVGVDTSNSDPEEPSEAAYLIDAQTYDLIARYVQSDPSSMDSDWFGTSVAIGPGGVAVGAAYDDDLGENSGSTYYFEFPPTACAADLNGDGSADFFDVSFLLQNAVDYNGDTGFDFFDISAFLQDLSAGCP